MVANLAAEAPVLVAVDDAQWADEASLRFLAYLARRLEGNAVAVSSVPAPTGRRARAPQRRLRSFGLPPRDGAWSPVRSMSMAFRECSAT